MKKHLLLLFFAYVAITAYGQTAIPNGNFESWDSTIFMNPQYYPYTSNTDAFFQLNLPPNVTQSTSAYHGAYAVQLTSIATPTDTLGAYILNVDPNSIGSTWTGGVPYSQMPAGIRGWYKYNVATADSATIIVAFSKAHANVGMYMFKFGGSYSAYHLFNFTFNPPLAVTPDSVIFAAASCRINVNSNGGPHPSIASTLVLDSVSFTGGVSQPLTFNGDFETWQSQTLYSPVGWYDQDEMGMGFARTTDAYKGKYAVELTTILGNRNNHAVAQTGLTSTGYFNNSCGCWKYGYPFSNQKDTLAFYYKYSPSGLDTAFVSLDFKKNGSTIGVKSYSLTAASSYQYKECPFNIGLVPDSVIVIIQSSSFNDTLLSFVGSDLKIDEIQFKSQPLHTGITNYENDNAISIFPNPVTNNLTIESQKQGVIEISNVEGQLIETYTTNGNKTNIDVSTLQSGVYFVKVKTDRGIEVKKFIKE